MKSNDSQCLQTSDVHEDLRQLSYGSVRVKSYGRYDVNGFRFRSTSFEATRPLRATTNTGVVVRVVDTEQRETNYYGIIRNILEFSFAGRKSLKVVFFDCLWFDPIHGTRGNQFGMVEVKHANTLGGNDNFILAHQAEQVYYMPYPCEKLNAWWVVYKVNPRERLHMPTDSDYHDSEEVAEVYQDDEVPISFNIDLDAALDSLVGDHNDVVVPEKRKRGCTKKKKVV